MKAFKINVMALGVMFAISFVFGIIWVMNETEWALAAISIIAWPEALAMACFPITLIIGLIMKLVNGTKKG